jgi:ribonuclease HI
MVALKALKAIRITSPLAQHCQKALKDISTEYVVELYWIPEHAGVQGNEIADELARDSSALKFVGPELALEVSRQDIRRRIRRWLVNHHWVWW